MSESSYWEGRLRHYRLPEFTSPPGPDAPTLKRLRLPQGSLAQIHDSPEGIHFLAWLELKAGGVRGNHVHRVKLEYFYMLAGQAVLHTEEIQTRETVALEVSAGDLVIIAPGIAHAIVSAEAGEALEFSPQRFDPQDTIRHVIASASVPTSTK